MQKAAANPAAPLAVPGSGPKSPGAFIGGLLLAVASLTVIANAAVAPSMPGLRDTFKDVAHVNTLVGMVITLPSLGIVLTAGIGGWLCDRFGRRPVMLTALILYGIAGVSAYFAQSLWQILAGRLLLGIGIGGTMTATMAMIGDLYHGSARIKFMSTQPVVMSGASVLLVLIGGVLGEISWRYPFVVYAVTFAMFPLVYAYLRETPRSAAAVTPGDDVFSVRLFLVIGLTALLSMIMYYLLPTRLPFLLRDLGIYSPSLGGAAVAVGAFTMAACASQFPRFGAGLRPSTVYALLFALTALGFWIIWGASSLTMVLVGSAVAGLGYGWLFPVNNILLMERASPAVRGRAAGFHTTSIFLGQFLSPVLTGPVAERTGEARTFLIFGSISAVIAAAFWLYGVARKSR